MRIIQSLKNLKHLKHLSTLDKDLLNKIDRDFQWMLNEYKSLDSEYSPEANGITVILEPGDTSDILKHIGISHIKDAIPEFVDEFDLRDTTYTKSLILFNNEYSVLIYANPLQIDKDFRTWIDTNL